LSFSGEGRISDSARSEIRTCLDFGDLRFETAVFDAALDLQKLVKHTSALQSDDLQRMAVVAGAVRDDSARYSTHLTNANRGTLRTSRPEAARLSAPRALLKQNPICSGIARQESAAPNQRVVARDRLVAAM
jgi:hypothetical protein